MTASSMGKTPASCALICLIIEMRGGATGEIGRCLPGLSASTGDAGLDVCIIIKRQSVELPTINCGDVLAFS